MTLRKKLMYILGRVHGPCTPLCVQHMLSFICGVQPSNSDKILTMYDTDIDAWMVNQDVIHNVAMHTISTVKKQHLLMNACIHGCINIVHHLCKRTVGPGIEKYKMTWAVAKGPLSIIHYMSSANSNPDIYTTECATVNGHSAVVHLLCEYTGQTATDEWELLRVHPIRYIWCDTEMMSVFGFVIMLTSPQSNLTKTKLIFLPCVSKFHPVLNLTNLIILTAKYIPKETKIDDVIEIVFIRFEDI